MDVVIVVCHPRPGSLCHAVAQRAAAATARAGRSAVVHDLYREPFDPRLTVEELDRGFSFDETVQLYGRELVQARLLVVAHPDWWGQPPALLKGWIDRVLRPGVAYDLESSVEGSRRQIPLMEGKKALVFCPTDAEVSTGCLELLWTRGVFEFCGLRDVEVSLLTDVRGSTHAGRQKWLAEVEAAVTAALTVSP